MRTIRLNVFDATVVRPNGNPFTVQCCSCLPMGNPFLRIGTGLGFNFDDNKDIRLFADSLVPGLTIMNVFTHTTGELCLLAHMNYDVGVLEIGNPVARITAVDVSASRIRFVEHTADGKRLIVGDPEKTNG